MSHPFPPADDAILAEIGDRLAAARLSRNLTQAALARDAGISKRTLERLEAGESAQLTSFLRVLRALGRLDGLDALLPPPRPGPIELLEAGGQPRRRASGSRADPGPPDEPWRWGDDGDDDGDEGEGGSSDA
ncbi:MAG: helix-turn-helix domain-containing protein [Gemmatimonadota bacterium]